MPKSELVYDNSFYIIPVITAIQAGIVVPAGFMIGSWYNEQMALAEWALALQMPTQAASETMMANMSFICGFGLTFLGVLLLMVALNFAGLIGERIREQKTRKPEDPPAEPQHTEETNIIKPFNRFREIDLGE
jgi:hypothetical protein